VAFGGVDPVDCTAGPALWPAFSVHLDTDAGLRYTGYSGGRARTASELPRAVIRTATEALTKEICMEAWADICTRPFVTTLPQLELELEVEGHDLQDSLGLSLDVDEPLLSPASRL